MNIPPIAMSSQKIGLWLKRIGIGMLAAVAIVGWSLAVSRDQQVRDLTTARRQQRPITDYNTGFFVHLDCIKAYEVRFFADIAAAAVAPADETAKTPLVADRDALRVTQRKFCPSPTAPTFTDDGDLKTPPIIPAQTFPSP